MNITAFFQSNALRPRPALTAPRQRQAAQKDVMPYAISSHDGIPEHEARIVDDGLGLANDLAAPLHEVRPLSCFARDEKGQVVGGAIGRRWGTCCEIQQLWVTPERQRAGLGTQLVRTFEAAAALHGCTSVYLETFSFQAPGFYASLGYAIAHEHQVYPHGISRLLMVKPITPSPSAG